ncbi:hypothetical protein AGR8A_pTi10095 [Agrobacterium fabrum str. J-07]|nr:hypothetical protein AGR8A_pTi10095 [Agrobacterium fabrum str. J-07]
MANSQAQSDRNIGMSNEITQMYRDGKVVISELMSGLVTERFAPEFELSRTTFCGKTRILAY